MKVILSVSLYAPLHERFDDIKKFLVNNNLNYEIFRTGNRFDKILLKNSEIKKARFVAENCEKCVIVYREKIGKCAPGMFIADFNRYFDTCYLGHNSQSLERFQNAKELLLYLDKEVPLCQWCTGDSQVESYPWEHTQNISIDDYIICNE